jgi:thiol-disulfide isomerase/thioredoxin
MASRRSFRTWVIAFAGVFAAVAVMPLAAQEKDKVKQKPADPQAEPAKDKEQGDKKQRDKDQVPADRYLVPDGDSGKLITFITELRRVRPRTQEEFETHIEKMPKAVKAAVEKVLAQEKDSKSELAQKAKTLLLETEVMFAFQADAATQAKLLEKVKEYVTAAGAEISVDQARLAMGIAQVFERIDPKKAAAAYETFFERFSKAKDQRIAGLPERMAPRLRRLKLPGNEIKLTGTTVEGKEFDWASYRGKVVLIDFWATWCGPCLAELPNVKENYDRFHDKGFEVVGISLDQDKQALEKFLSEEKLPWVTLHEKGGMHPAAEYYAIESIPTVILVDKEGKVVSLNARGEALGEHLEKMLGSAEKAAKRPAKE